jgi:subtilase family serine protease
MIYTQVVEGDTPPVGICEFRATADLRNAIRESNEENNIAQKKVIIKH